MSELGAAEYVSGLVNFEPVDSIMEVEREEAAHDVESRQDDEVTVNLVGHIQDEWSMFRQAKLPIEKRLLTCLRQRKGEYDSAALDRIRKQGGTEVFIKLTDNVCRAVESWLKDILLPPGERPWAARPTPIPELPPEDVQAVSQRVLQEFQQAVISSVQAGQFQSAEQAMGYIRQQMAGYEDELKEQILKELREKANSDADSLEREIDDELVDGKWYGAMNDLVYDVATYPAAFMHGPVVRRRKKLGWLNGEPEVLDVLQREYESVSPFDIYPSPGAKNIQDGRLIHRLRWDRQDLEDLIGVPGFDEETIRYILDRYGESGLREWLSNDTERAQLQDRDHEQDDSAGMIDCLKYMGAIQGKMLVEWGMDEVDVPDQDINYHVEAYLIDDKVIGVKLNPHPLGRRSYYSTAYRRSNDSIWGTCPPEMMADIQKICNAAVRAMVNNMGIASGPMVWSFVDKLPMGESAGQMYPWKHFKFTSENMTGSQPPMGFFQPDANIGILQQTYEYWAKQASEVTGIPRYIYGDERVGGAGRTAAGLRMLMNAAGKGLKAVAANIDNDITKPSVEEHWFHIMYFEPERAKGDIQIVARASEYLIVMDQIQAELGEALNETNNDIDFQIMGLAGRAELLRSRLKSLKVNIDDIIPDRKSLQVMERQGQMRQVFENIAKALGIDPAQVAQMAQGGGGPPQQQGQRQIGQHGSATGGAV